MTSGERRVKLLRRAPALGYGLLFVAGVVAAAVGDKGYFDLVRLRAERERAADELDAERERVAAARQAIVDLESDTLTRERIAREKLGLVAPDEVLILLSDDPRAHTAPRRPVPSAPEPSR